MAEKWSLKRTKQCALCPWRTDVDPHDIPNGYCEIKHKALASTIAIPGDLSYDKAMACHGSNSEDRMHCIGWLSNQIGAGNNIGLRRHLMNCENADQIELVGEQHETLEDTLP